MGIIGYIFSVLGILVLAYIGYLCWIFWAITHTIQQVAQYAPVPCGYSKTQINDSLIAPKQQWIVEIPPGTIIAKASNQPYFFEYTLDGILVAYKCTSTGKQVFYQTIVRSNNINKFVLYFSANWLFSVEYPAGLDPIVEAPFKYIDFLTILTDNNASDHDKQLFALIKVIPYIQGNNTIEQIQMQNDRNLVAYGANNSVIWASGTNI